MSETWNIEAAAILLLQSSQSFAVFETGLNVETIAGNAVPVHETNGCFHIGIDRRLTAKI